MVDESDLRLKYVLDGQQRIITLCLLFAAARARFLESDDQADLEFAKEIEAMLKMVRPAGCISVWQAAAAGCLI